MTGDDTGSRGIQSKKKYAQGQFVGTCNTWLYQVSQNTKTCTKHNLHLWIQPCTTKDPDHTPCDFFGNAEFHGSWHTWQTDWLRKFRCIYSPRNLIIWNIYQSFERSFATIVKVKSYSKVARSFGSLGIARSITQSHKAENSNFSTTP